MVLIFKTELSSSTIPTPHKQMPPYGLPYWEMHKCRMLRKYNPRWRETLAKTSHYLKMKYEVKALPLLHTYKPTTEYCKRATYMTFYFQVINFHCIITVNIFKTANRHILQDFHKRVGSGSMPMRSWSVLKKAETVSNLIMQYSIWSLRTAKWTRLQIIYPCRHQAIQVYPHFSISIFDQSWHFLEIGILWLYFLW